MRIAYLTQSYPPMISGAALVVEGLAKAMAKRGHQVLVIGASDRKQAYRTEAENLTLLRIQSLHNPLRAGQRFALYPRAAVMKALREFDPEIIHVHEPFQLSLLSVEYASQVNINVPIILTVHQIPSFIASYLPNFLRVPMATVLWSYARWFARKFASIITPTPTISKLFQQMTDLQVNTISSGVDLDLFYPALSCEERTAARQKWNLPPNSPILLHVGRLDIEKHVERVIQAAVGVLHQTDAHLLIVGDGSQKNDLIKLSNELGLAERVHFPGFISAQEGLPELYRAASLFVTASEIETQGIVVLEALASALPIVAVRATCMHEMVYEGINGYLIEPGDIFGMSKAMTPLLRNSKQARRLGKASRALVEKHKLLHTLDAHEMLYNNLISQAYEKPLV